MIETYSHAYIAVNRQNFIDCNRRSYNVRAMSLADRLTARMKKLGMSQAELARRIGVSQPTISALAKGDSRSSVKLHAIARELETTTDWLEGLTDDTSPSARPMPSREALADQLGLALIPEIEVGYSMGGGAVIEDFPTLGFRAFDRDFLTGIARGQSTQLFVARGDGDSMQPTMMHGDNVLIDTSERVINQQDRIWAFTYGELGMIKRVRRLPGGRFELLSDNSTIPPKEIDADDMHVIGRVVWIGRRI